MALLPCHKPTFCSLATREASAGSRLDPAGGRNRAASAPLPCFDGHASVLSAAEHQSRNRIRAHRERGATFRALEPPERRNAPTPMSAEAFFGPEVLEVYSTPNCNSSTGRPSFRTTQVPPGHMKLQPPLASIVRAVALGQNALNLPAMGPPY